MKLSVAICTWNRAPMLEQALRSLHDLAVPAGVDWELLVVDNNSSDATAEVIRAHTDALPLRPLFEGKAGKSHALNLASREARGDYILWTDDDVLVDPGWLAAYADAFRRFPDAALFGGRVLPWFDGDPPAWLQRVLPRVESAFAVRDLGEDGQHFDDKLIPYGVNMAVRTAEQRRFLYDTGLGPRPGSPLRREDVVLARGLLTAGFEGRYVAGAVIRHFIPQARQTRQYLEDYYRGEGEYYAKRVQDRGPKWFGRPRWAWKDAIKAELRYRVRRLVAAPEIWVEDLKHACMARGRLFGSTGSS